MHETHNFLSDVAVVVGVAAVTGLLARFLGQPAILGYLLAGLIVGPSVAVPLFADPERTQALAEFGVVLVMFAVGLEFRLARFAKVLPKSGFTALVQVAFLAWVGFSAGRLLGWGDVGAAFLGAALAISSTMVVSGIFREQTVDEDVREHVLGVLVIQDVVAIVLIAAMTALAAGQSLAPAEILSLMTRLAGVLVGLFAGGLLVIPRLVRHVVQRGGTEGLAVLAAAVAFVYATLAHGFGYSVALGAFVAGMVVAESGQGSRVEHVIEPLRAVFAAIFFVSIGMAVDPFVALRNLPVALVVSALVVSAQLFSVSTAGLLSGNPLRRSVLAGLALGQVGEFSFILAAVGIEADAVPDALLPTLVTTAAVTAFTTPLLLKRGEAIVEWVDRRIPPRVQHLIAVQQGFADKLRAGPRAFAPLRPALAAVAVDWVAIMILVPMAHAVQVPASRAVEAMSGVTSDVAAIAVDVVGVAIVLPFLIGLVRNAGLVAHAAARAVGETDAPTSALFEALTTLVLVVGVGLPAVALLSPLARGPWGLPFLLLGFALAVALVWRNLHAVEGEFRSGVGTLATELARRAGSEEAAPVENRALIPGLDRVLAVPLTPTSRCVGRTLAELNLRARCGATVVAIHKPNAQVLLPTGHERLEPGDVLALAGEPEAMARAHELLLDRSDDHGEDALAPRPA